MGLLGGPQATAGAIGFGMGADTYQSLRHKNISPLISLPSAAIVGITSYATNNFTIGNVTRYLLGKSPFKAFSLGTVFQIAEEMGQEFA